MAGTTRLPPIFQNPTLKVGVEIKIILSKLTNSLAAMKQINERLLLCDWIKK